MSRERWFYVAPEEVRRRWEKRDKSGEKSNTWSCLSIWIYGKHHSETHLSVLRDLSPPIFKGVFITSLTTVNLREGDSLRPSWPGRQGGRIQSCWSQISVAKKQRVNRKQDWLHSWNSLLPTRFHLPKGSPAFPKKRPGFQTTTKAINHPADFPLGSTSWRSPHLKTATLSTKLLTDGPGEQSMPNHNSVMSLVCCIR